MNIVETLPDKLRDIIERRTGIKNGSPETLEEIAKCYGVSRERVRQLQEKAIDAIRPYVLSIDEKLEFMSIWQTCESVKAVSERLGIAYATVYTKAKVLRSQGFKLKVHAHGGKRTAVLSPAAREAVDPKFKARQDRTRRLIEVWNKGHRPQDIYKEFGFSSPASVAAEVCRLRKEGHHLLMRNRLRSNIVPSEEFIRGWNSSKSIKEACEKLGMTYGTAYQRYMTMKKHGIELRKFEGKRERYSPSVIERLKKVALETLASIA